MFVLPHAGLPSDFVIPTTTSVPSCSNPSRTKALRVARYARPSLTASVRAGSTRLSVGAKKRLARSNKETLREEKMDRTLPANPPLTKIAPYKVSLTPA
jgi:hypothetical protein